MILHVSPNCCKTCKPRSMHLNKHMQVCVANSFACTNVHFPFLSPKCSRCVHLSLSHNCSIDEEEVATQISGTLVQNNGIHDINLQFNVDGEERKGQLSTLRLQLHLLLLDQGSTPLKLQNLILVVSCSILHDLEGKAKSQAQYFHVACLHSLSIYPSYLGINVLFSKRNQANTSLLCGLKNIEVMYLCHALKVLDCWCMNPESGADHQDSSTQCLSRLC